MSDYLTYIKTDEKEKYQKILSEIQGAGNRIHTLRELKDISQDKLAKDAGMTSRQNIYKLEQHESISLEMATRLAAVLETTPEYLLCLSDNPFGHEFDKTKLLEHVNVMQDKIISLSADLQKLKDLLK